MSSEFLPRKILIVGNHSTQLKSQESLARVTDYVRGLLKDDNIVCYATYLDDILYSVSPDMFEAYDTRNELSIRDVDCVMIRGYGIVRNTKQAHYLSVFCDQNDVPCMLSYSNYYPATKLAQAAIFRELGVPFLRTLYTQNRQKLLEHAPKQLGYPFILKDSVGERGESNYLIRTAEQARTAFATEPETDFLAQEFCPNDRDYRMLMTGEKYLLFERRGRADSHLNNTSQGGTATVSDVDTLPQSIIDQAHTIMARLRLKLGGLDVIPNLTTGELYFLEVNTQPQVQSGSLIEEKKKVMHDLLLTLADSKKRA